VTSDQFDGSSAGVAPRDRPFPPTGLGVDESLVAFLRFIHLTSINKAAGLTEALARATPIPTSPNLSILGLLKHMTAVLRQHVQIHIGDSELPSLWRADDLDFEFRLGPDDHIANVVAAFDEELERSLVTLAAIDLDAEIIAYDEPNRAGRLLVDVLQELARHLGHLDILRELADGSRGE
jgi:hypothetical protein